MSSKCKLATHDTFKQHGGENTWGRSWRLAVLARVPANGVPGLYNIKVTQVFKVAKPSRWPRITDSVTILAQDLCHPEGVVTTIQTPSPPA